MLEKESLLSTIATWDNTIADLEGNIKTLKDTNTKNEQNTQKLIADIWMTEQELTKLKTESELTINEQKSENENLKEKISELEWKQNEEIEKMNKEIQDQKDTINRLSSQISSLSEDISK